MAIGVRRALLGLLLVGGSLVPVSATHAQGGAWLDAPLSNWNRPGMALPSTTARPPDNPNCANAGRPPSTHADYLLTEHGWQLFSAYQGGWGVEVIHAGSGVDGMCRPLGFNVFVFRHGQFVGTVSPDLMDSRTTGQEAGTTLLGPQGSGDAVHITSRFLRYAPSDPLCCPSLPAVVVEYEVTSTPDGWVLVPTTKEPG